MPREVELETMSLQRCQFNRDTFNRSNSIYVMAGVGNYGRVFSVPGKSNLPIDTQKIFKWSEASEKRIESLEAITSGKSDTFWKSKAKEVQEVQPIKRRGRVAAIFQNYGSQIPTSEEFNKSTASDDSNFQIINQRNRFAAKALKKSSKQKKEPISRYAANENSKKKFLSSLMELTVDSDENESNYKVSKTWHSIKSKKVEVEPTFNDQSSYSDIILIDSDEELATSASKSTCTVTVETSNQCQEVDVFASHAQDDVITISDSECSQMEDNEYKITTFLNKEVITISDDSQLTDILDYSEVENDHSISSHVAVTLNETEECDNWRKQFHYLHYTNAETTAGVNKDESICCEEVPPLLLTIFRLNLKCDSGIIDGLHFLDSLLTPESKLPEDIIKLLIKKLLTSTDEIVSALCYKMIAKQFAFHGWNYDTCIDIWRFLLQAAEQSINNNADAIQRESSYNLFLFLVTTLEDSWIKYNEKSIENCLAVRFLNCTRQFHKIRRILKCIEKICEHEKLNFECGCQLFRLLALTSSVNNSAEMTKRITEEIYSFATGEASTPYLRKFIIEMTEPHYLKMSLLILIVIKNTSISKNYECDEVTVSCKDLGKILENVNVLQNLRYVDSGLEEQYNEIIFVVLSMLKTFIKMIVEGTIENAYDNIQHLKSIINSVDIFCERVLTACSCVSKSKIEELKYLAKMLALM